MSTWTYRQPDGKADSAEAAGAFWWLVAKKRGRLSAKTQISTSTRLWHYNFAGRDDHRAKEGKRKIENSQVPALVKRLPAPRFSSLGRF